LLSDDHYACINEERDLLASLHSALSSLEAPRDTLDLIADTRSRIDDLFLMVVVGEFNAGKSTFINALLGAEYLQTGVLPTTDKICLLRSVRPSEDGGTDRDGGGGSSCGDGTHVGTQHFLLDDVEDRVVPTEWLRNVAVIDTPGTNALLSRHEQLTQQIVPRADLVLFVTSAERPLSDSEAAFLDKISQWGKKVLVVINKMDMLPSDAEREQVVEFVRTHITARLRREDPNKPLPLFPISARMALEAKLRLDDEDMQGLVQSPEWARSGVGALEAHLRTTLASGKMVGNKLGNPLGVCDRIIAEQLSELRLRQEALRADVRTIELLRENSRAFETDVGRDARYAKERVDVLVAQQAKALSDFLTEELVQSQWPSQIMDMAPFKAKLQRVVALELEGALKETVTDLTELVSARSHSQARTTLQYVGERHKANVRARNFIGTLAPPSTSRLDEVNRQLRDRLQLRCKSVVEDISEDQPSRAAAAARAVRGGYFQLMGLHMTALTSAGLVANLAPTLSPVELAAGALVTFAPLGLSTLVLPQVHKTIASSFGTRGEKLQEQIATSVETVLESELHTVTELIGASVAPYERFVDFERRTTDEMITRLDALRSTARRLRTRLNSLADNY
jgi:ribosome biogenesis GTPase A